MIRVECSGCGAKGQIDESRRPPGAMSVRCPKCGAQVPLPPDEDVTPAIVPPAPVQPAVFAAPAPGSPPSLPVDTEEPLPTLGRPAAAETGEPAGEACTLCGRTFDASDLARFGNDRVCAECKPGYVQLLRQGAPVAAVQRYGGFWVRVAAKLLDGLILWVVNMVITFAGIWTFFGRQDNPRLALATMGVQWVLQLAVAAAYTTYFLGAHGATPGKMALKLEVVRPDGERLTYLRALGRHFAEMLSSLILCIGYIMVAFDDEKRALHDRICDTRVVYK
jgi:uncharacterized RDD family membrane protein YckC